MKYYDQHVHTKYSHDSQVEIKEYIDICLKNGITTFISTDHYEMMYGNVENQKVDLLNLTKDINKLTKLYPDFTFLIGGEFGYKREYINEINEMINLYDYDLINLSVHEYHDIDFYRIDNLKDRYPTLNANDFYNIYLDLAIEAASRMDNYDVFCHFDYGLKKFYMIDKTLDIKVFEDKIKTLFSILIKKNKCLEINVKVQREFPLSHTKYILDLYKSMGGENLTLSSDSHRLEQFMYNFDVYMDLIKQCGFDHLNYFIKRKSYKFFL